MGFQKCPICDGTGYVQYSGCGDVKCTVCNGEKIISELTGRPPGTPTPTPAEPKNVFVGPGHKGCYSDYYAELHKKLREEIPIKQTGDKK